LEKKLNGYKGALSPRQIAQGINAANKNAYRLAKDAKLMLDAGRYPSAASFAILSIEESGKVSILRGLALAKDEKDIAEHWRDYRSHTKKNVSWILPELAAKGARRLEDLRPIFDENSDHPYLLDQIKQISFYTDCLGKAHWSLPEDVIEQSLAETLVQIAEVFSNNKQEATVLEIELWIKHMKPVWKTSMIAMKKALINWSKDMMENGLSTNEENNMEKSTSVPMPAYCKLRPWNDLKMV
jgi:AbiV family abortive infection protein